MPTCGSCKVPLQSVNDSLKCDKCNKNHHWNWTCTKLDDYKIKLHKKIHTNPGDVKIALINIALTATKPFLKNAKIVFAVTNVPSGFTPIVLV